jgi:hypothetical protein
MEYQFPKYVTRAYPITNGQHLPIDGLTVIPQNAFHDIQTTDTLSSGCVQNSESIQQYLTTTSNFALDGNYCNGFATDPFIQYMAVPFPNHGYNSHQLSFLSNADLGYERFECASSSDGKDATGPIMGGQSHALVVPARKCKWEGCKYMGSFGRDTDLLRHVKAVHVSPSKYRCPLAGCGKLFGRKDGMETHRRTHMGTGGGLPSSY